LGLVAPHQRLGALCPRQALASKVRRNKIGSRNDSVFPDPVPEVTTIFFSFELDEKRVQEICEYQRKNYLKKNRVENVNPIYFTYYEF
jgi:hypothetical protein